MRRKNCPRLQLARKTFLVPCIRHSEIEAALLRTLAHSRITRRHLEHECQTIRTLSKPAQWLPIDHPDYSREQCRHQTLLGGREVDSYALSSRPQLWRKVVHSAFER